MTRARLLVPLALVAGTARPGAGGEVPAAGEAEAPAARRAGKVVKVERPPARVVEIDGGTFSMGLAIDDLERLEGSCSRLHGEQRAQVVFTGGLGLGFCEEYRVMGESMLMRDVHVSAFGIDRWEVTVDDYRGCVRAGACGIDPLIDGDERYLGDDLPIVNVTWTEARAYCAWQGGRLPTEAEWERAARGDDQRRFPWGDRERPDDWNHGQMPSAAMVAVDDLLHRSSGPRLNFTDFGDSDDSDGFTYAAPVGSFVWDEGPFGTHDQAGNVAEWVEDEYSLHGYLGLPASNPVRGRDTGATVPRVVRGGSWRDPSVLGEVAMRAPINRLITGDQRHPHVGFRCAYDR